MESSSDSSDESSSLPPSNDHDYWQAQDLSKLKQSKASARANSLKPSTIKKPIIP
jgi:hypothetical protein